LTMQLLQFIVSLQLSFTRLDITSNLKQYIRVIIVQVISVTFSYVLIQILNCL